MPRGTSGATSCLLDHFMYIFGGFTEHGNVNSLYRVNLSPLRNHKEYLKTKSTRIEPQITFEKICVSNPDLAPMPCDKSVSWTHGGKLYIFGGYGYEPSMKLTCHLPRSVKFHLDFDQHNVSKQFLSLSPFLFFLPFFFFLP